MRSAAAAFAALVVVGCATTPAPPAQDRLAGLLAAEAAARGGPALERLRDLRASLTVFEPDEILESELRLSRDGRLRRDIFREGARIFSEGLLDGQSWEMAADADEPSPTAGQARVALRRELQLSFYSLAELVGLGNMLEPRRAVTINGERHSALELTFADGARRRLFLSVRTGLVTRERGEEPLHPTLDRRRRTIERRHSDFRAVNGVTVPFQTQTVDLDTGEVLRTEVVRALVVNPGLARADFEPPKG